MTTCAPAAAKPKANALPTRCAPPVTTATLPVSSILAPIPDLWRLNQFWASVAGQSCLPELRWDYPPRKEIEITTEHCSAHDLDFFSGDSLRSDVSSTK